MISALLPVAANVTVEFVRSNVADIVVAAPRRSVKVALIDSLAVVDAGMSIEIVPLFLNLPLTLENASVLLVIAGTGDVIVPVVPVALAL